MPPGYSSRDDRCGIVGLRRSGTFATATSGAAYWAASVRHGPPWPLPVNAPKSIFQNSILYRAANSVGSPPSCGEGLGGRELRLQTRPYSHRAKHLGRHDHLGLVPPLIQLEKRSGEFRREQKVLSRISGLSGRHHTLKAVVRKLGVNRQQSVRGAGEYGRRVPEFLNPTKEHGFIQPQSGGKDAFDSEPACLS